MIWRGAILLALFASLGAAAPAGAASYENGRYFPSGREFSIDMSNPDDNVFRFGKERADGDFVFVDLAFAPGQMHGGFMQRSVEWLKIKAPLAAEQRDAAANELIDGFLAGRFGAGKFTIADRRKTRTDEGRPIYLFAAKGDAGDLPSGWQGVVIVFDTGIALVSSVMSLNMVQNGFVEKDGVFDGALVHWAATIRPET